MSDVTSYTISETMENIQDQEAQENQEITQEERDSKRSRDTRKATNALLVMDKTEVAETMIKDKEAYHEWMRLKHAKILNEGRFLTASDGIVYNMGNLPHVFRRQIEHLPEKEQKKFLILKDVYQKTLTKANGMKMKAFAYQVGRSRVREADQEEKFTQNVLYPRKAELIELFGRMFSVKEVHKIVVEEWKLPVSLRAVYVFRTRYIDDITQRIDKFKAEFSDIRLGVKRGRLEELVYLYLSMKEKYEQTQTTFIHKSLLANLEQIRKEVEGDSLRVVGNLELKIEADINQHLKQEVFKSVNINQIIIGRVASRIGVSSAKLIQTLTESFYSSISGIVRPVDEEFLENMEYPSAVPYDFTAIEKIVKGNEEREQEFKKKEKARNEEFSRMSEGMDLKAKLMLLVSAEKKIADEKTTIVEKSMLMNELKGTSGVDRVTPKLLKKKFVPKKKHTKK